MEQSGHFLWEGITFLTVIFVGIGLLVLRRKASGRAAFTDDDRQLFFGHSQVTISTLRFCVNFCIAVVLCYFAGLLEHLILAPFGASVLAIAQLLTLMGIVKKWLC